MNEPQKGKPALVGTEPAKFYLPATTMAALRREAAMEGCAVTHIAGRVLNAYARGEIKHGFTQEPGPDNRQK